jgi:hypothetical protein
MAQHLQVIILAQHFTKKWLKEGRKRNIRATRCEWDP